MELTDAHKDLIAIATDHILKNYKKGQHHVACALRCDGKDYLSLHLDTKGFDVCAEPIALSNALSDGQVKFDSIVAVLLDETKQARVVAPCGNCRQILYEYAPDIQVIVPDGDSHALATATALFPHPYA
jgi:cytidine deaminase